MVVLLRLLPQIRIVLSANKAIAWFNPHAISIISLFKTSFGVSGKIYLIKNTGSGTITVATTGGQTIDGNSTKSLTQNQSITLQIWTKLKIFMKPIMSQYLITISMTHPLVRCNIIFLP